MSSHLKTLHVIDSGGLYGAENVVLSLMLEHKKQGVHVELASIAEPGIAPKVDDLLGLGKRLDDDLAIDDGEPESGEVWESI